MRTISRRLRKLEDRFGLAPETEFDRQLRAQIEAGRRRVAQARERGELSSPIYDDEDQEDLTGLSVAEILDRGRARVARAKAEREEADSAPGLATAWMVSGSLTKLADHNDEEDSAFVPAAEPAHLPIIDTIAERHRLAKPKELGLNVHGNSRPNTSMARLERTVNRLCGNGAGSRYHQK
ncbi:MAG TPA: hypothetical protein VK335_04540 [Bryobacteraceae bacterium]|nr:hypothetical protein [Bryobacteraceae bacterium]HZW96210.1 hypothetical protein [Candidatus Eremiobacteraceae bacterium]